MIEEYNISNGVDELNAYFCLTMLIVSHNKQVGDNK